MIHPLARWTCVLLALLPAALAQERRPMGAIDVGRIRELYQLTDRFGKKLWPGFDTREIPIAVNHEDRQEMLIGHPKPPKEFRVFEGHELNGEPIMIRDGCTRYGPKGGGWATDVAGEHSAYVSTLAPGRDTEGYLSLLLHECFHVYQRRIRESAEGHWADRPADDPVYAAMIGLESHVLHAALHEQNDRDARTLAKMFVAVRRERRKDLASGVVLAEGEEEYSEGTATYVQARLMQLLAGKGVKPVLKKRDPQYNGFVNASTEYQSYLRRILPLTTRPITFMHAKYNLGMAQCLLLDRLKPGWKKAMREKGATLFAQVARKFPARGKRAARLVADARKRFDYDGLLEAQKKLIGGKLDTIRGFLHAKGRRYRVHHGNLRGTFKWKPRGPVYTVPASLLDAADMKRAGRVTVWAGGMRFEKSGLVLESKEVPIIFRHDYLEWIDREPAADESDLAITCDRSEEGLYQGLRLVTDGFVLTIPRARILKSEAVVDIHPVP